ncbi:hypothetical protein DL95DRAFT_416304, partial [Leptodontidium sp. 2 PMI_412]
MKSLRMLFFILAFLATLVTTAQATALFKPVARIVSSVAPVPTVAFGGPTPEMAACLKKTECNNAALIYHYCAEGLLGSKFNNWMMNPNRNNTAAFECLCSTYHDIWRSSLQRCIPCLATSLANHPDKISPPALNSSFLPEQVLLNLDPFCLNKHSK